MLNDFEFIINSNLVKVLISSWCAILRNSTSFLQFVNGVGGLKDIIMEEGSYNRPNFIQIRI